jgi:hypothetical protein
MKTSVHVFIDSTMVLSATVNLMGPAVAVLLLPVQQRATVEALRRRATYRFSAGNSAQTRPFYLWRFARWIKIF